jgi:hypothetical protein
VIRNIKNKSKIRKIDVIGVNMFSIVPVKYVIQEIKMGKEKKKIPVIIFIVKYKHAFLFR